MEEVNLRSMKTHIINTRNVRGDGSYVAGVLIEVEAAASVPESPPALRTSEGGIDWFALR